MSQTKQFRLDCEFCDSTIEAPTSETLKERGESHLDTNHRDTLEAKLSDQFGGESCRNGCGYVFSTEEWNGFDCEKCGHDNFSQFVRQYLYWQIEESQ